MSNSRGKPHANNTSPQFVNGEPNIGSDDLHQERKDNLLEYLSDNTRNTGRARPDGKASDYGVDSDGRAENSESYFKTLEEHGDMNDAIRAFESLSNSHGLSDALLKQPKGQHVPGPHKGLGPEYVETVQNDIQSNTNNRWSKLLTSHSDDSKNFTLQHTYSPKPEEDRENLSKTFRTGEELQAAVLKNSEYGSDMQEEYRPTDNSGRIPISDVSSEAPLIGETAGTYTGYSWGQSYNSDKKFFANDKGGTIESKAKAKTEKLKELTKAMLEVWMEGQQQLLVTGNLMQLGNWSISEVDAWLHDPPESLGAAFTHNPSGDWDTAIYKNLNSPNLNPVRMYKGSSGYNQDAIRLNIPYNPSEGSENFLERLGEYLQNLTANFEDDANSLINVVAYWLRELNIHMPRHTMSMLLRSRQRTGIEEGIIVYVSYALASAQGLAQFLVHLTVGGILDDATFAYWENMIRNIRKTSVFNKDIRDPDFAWQDMFNNIDERIIRFVNVLAIIGDKASASMGGYNNVNRVPLDQLANSPATRLATYRMNLGSRGSQKSTFSMDNLPNLYLRPKAADSIELAAAALDDGYGGWHLNGSTPETGRFSTEQVKKVEDQLEAELMPFYIQDLRTNEIISFHAFLTNLTDSYNATWTAQQGFGRIEPAQIYGGASRSIGVGFTMVSFNKDDFDEMWYKINKLTTLVYPQWSRGTMMENSIGQKFIQPFSQVPTASPLCRIRVGDIFTSNYSKTNIARLMGLGEEGTSFKYETVVSDQLYLTAKGVNSMFDDMSRMLNFAHLNDAEYSDMMSQMIDSGYLENVPAEIRESFGSGGNYIMKIIAKLPDGDEITVVRQDWPWKPQSENIETWKNDWTRRKVVLSSVTEDEGIKQFFDTDNNPIIRAFENNSGRGLAVAINSVGFEWGWGESTWNTDPGSKAPRTCTVSLGLIPIHDITPGLDHNGINRAPIYGVGSKMSGLKGDPHYNPSEYNQLLGGIQANTYRSFNGKEPRK